MIGLVPSDVSCRKPILASFRESWVKFNENYSVKDADIRNYAKYPLTEGSMFEKRDLLGRLKSKIILREKNISIN